MSLDNENRTVSQNETDSKPDPSRSDSSSPPKILQFDFKLHWDSLVRPHLDDQEVVKSLYAGMFALTEKYGTGKKKKFKKLLKTPPYAIPHVFIPEDKNRPERCIEDLRRYNANPLPHTLEWYRPYKSCHYIAYFVLALAKKMFPAETWLIHSSDCHSVVTNQRRTIVMDLLEFEDFDGATSLAMAGDLNATGYRREFDLLFDSSGVVQEVLDFKNGLNKMKEALASDPSLANRVITFSDACRKRMEKRRAIMG